MPCTGGLLELRGEQTGVWQIAPEALERVRIGYSDGKRRSYETQLWLADGSGRLELVPLNHQWPAYVTVVRALAATLAGKGLLGRVETGSSRFGALLPVVLFGLLALAAIGISLFALGNEPWWGRLIVPALPLLLFSLFVWTAVKRAWPRPLARLDDLNVQLPPVA